MKNTILFLLGIGGAVISFAQSYLPSPTSLNTWGDQGNGTYINPILNADYSDPDVIRVGNKYYMVASDFHFLGMQVLESEDMVNWKLLSQVYSRFDFPGWDTNDTMPEDHGPPQSAIMMENSGFSFVHQTKDYSCRMQQTLLVHGVR